jgi:hypothetical protein
MKIPPSAYPAIGVVMAAIIAGGISFLVTVLSKDHKTSEFRQAWIDALRDDLSEFVANVDALTSLYRFKLNEGHSREQLFAFWEGKSEDIRIGLTPNSPSGSVRMLPLIASSHDVV